MKIIPAIYILDGKCVALYKGSFDHKETYRASPLEMAHIFERDGAEQLYLVDLNGKKEDSFVQKEIVTEIIDAINIPIILEAGFASIDAIHDALDLGVSSIVLRIPDSNYTEAVIEEIGADRIFIQIQAKGSEVKGTKMAIVDYAEDLIPLGVKKIIYKDERKEGTLIHPNYDEVDRLFLIVGSDLEIYVSGGVGSVRHLGMLKKIGASGAIVGKALYERKFRLSQTADL